MTTITRNKITNWALAVAVIGLVGLLLWLAPEEQTLGSGIKSVYVHVALTWTALLGIIAAGLIGLALAVFSKPSWLVVASTLIWVALVIFAAGLVMSFIAAGINWGGFFWQEPRTNSAIQIIVAAMIVQGANHLSLPYRVKGALFFFLLLFIFWSILSIPDVLHPGDAARTSPPAIRFTFYGLFALFSLAAGWFVWRVSTLRSIDSHQNITDKSLLRKS
jgi:hypothetical protein